MRWGSQRDQLPDPSTLPPITVAALAASKEEPTPDPGDLWSVCILGYVLHVPRSKVPMNSHRGRDITARMSRQARGISLDTNDDMGRPPYRLPAHMAAEEAEHVRRWLDTYLDRVGLEGIVGFLAEYRAQSESEGLM